MTQAGANAPHELHCDRGRRSCSPRHCALLQNMLDQAPATERPTGIVRQSMDGLQILLIYSKQQICLENVSLLGFSVTSNPKNSVFA